MKALTIQDFAIVRHLDLEFQPGLTAITGETGAGKSIVVDALGLVLGDRAESALIRADAERAVVSARFETGAIPGLADYLAAAGLNRDSDCLLRRVIGADGRSRAFCNESPVTLQVLKEIGAYLVDIHSQHEHHSLLQRGTQRKLVDEYARLGPELGVVAAAYANWRRIAGEWEAMRYGDGDPVARVDFLRFQIAELNSADIGAIDIGELEAEHRRQSNRQRLRTGCDDVIAKVFDGERAALKLATVGHHQLRDLESIDTNLKPVVDLIDQALINLVEAERELNSYRHRIAGENTEALARVERQLERIHDLCRKHRSDPRDLPDTLRRLQEDLFSIENRDARAAELELRVTEARTEYERAADALSTARKQAAAPMARTITETLRQLGLPHARFSIEIAAGVESGEGRDEIEFMVTMNPDQAPRPLRKVASGGELSRVSLAVQVATTGIAQVPVLVYDEIDAGIGGRTASVIAQHLRSIAAGRQVLCITHLAQVASAGANHVVITKRIADGATHTEAMYLAPEERVEEIARMLGGAELTARSRAHAREMLAE